MFKRSTGIFLVICAIQKWWELWYGLRIEVDFRFYLSL